MSQELNRSEQSRSDLPIVMYFRLRSSSGNFVSCRSFRTSGGIELRFGPDEGPAEKSMIVGSHQAARELAATWRTTLASYFKRIGSESGGAVTPGPALFPAAMPGSSALSSAIGGALLESSPSPPAPSRPPPIAY